MASFFPQHEGWLPSWLLFVSVIALGNSLQAYLTLHYTRRLYNGSEGTNDKKSDSVQATSPATPLSGRTFGTWTALQSVVRLYAAYNISNPAMYQLALWTYVIAFWHFGSEWLYFGSTRWSRALAGPIIISTSSMVWMVTQWSFYVK